MHAMTCQCPKCRAGASAGFEAVEFEMSPLATFEFETEDEAQNEYEFEDDDENDGNNEYEYAGDDEAWESERRRGRAIRRSRPTSKRSSSHRKPKSKPGSRPPTRRAPRHSPYRRSEPAAPCVCPAPGTEYVRWVQSTLNQVESASLPVNGVMNTATRSALRKFQSRKGLTVDGIAGPDVEQALRDSRRPADVGEPADEPAQAQGEFYEFDEFETLELEAPSGTPTLRRGSRGAPVADLQRRLSAAGFSAGTADGIFGTRTDVAVRAFQRARGLGVDGVAGPQTWGALLGRQPSGPSVPGGATSKTWVLPASVRTAGDAQTVRYDSPPAWAGMPGNCTGTFTAGAAALKAHILATFAGVSSIGGYSCRQNSANRSETSVHGTGRALDIMIRTVGGKANSSVGDPIANWLVRNAAAIGVQYIIWNRVRWSGNRTPRVAGYTGPNPHVDHVHVELNNDGAARRTPWFRDHEVADAFEFELEADRGQFERAGKVRYCKTCNGPPPKGLTSGQLTAPDRCGARWFVPVYRGYPSNSWSLARMVQERIRATAGSAPSRSDIRKGIKVHDCNTHFNRSAPMFMPRFKDNRHTRGGNHYGAIFIPFVFD